MRCGPPGHIETRPPPSPLTGPGSGSAGWRGFLVLGLSSLLLPLPGGWACPLPLSQSQSAPLTPPSATPAPELMPERLPVRLPLPTHPLGQTATLPTATHPQPLPTEAAPTAAGSDFLRYEYPIEVHAAWLRDVARFGAAVQQAAPDAAPSTAGPEVTASVGGREKADPPPSTATLDPDADPAPRGWEGKRDVAFRFTEAAVDSVLDTLYGLVHRRWWLRMRSDVMCPVSVSGT
jgi:hypothetical protein